MAVIRPFRALRPHRPWASSVAALPYDVVDMDEARRMAGSNPLSFLHVEKSEIDLPSWPPTDEEEIYRTARGNLARMIAGGIFFREEIPCLYIYRQIIGTHVQHGIVATVSVRDYEQNIIRKHEATRADKEWERFRHVDMVNAHTGPVFLTYRSRTDIDAQVAKLVRNLPEYDFVSENGVAQTVWVVADRQDIAALENSLATVETLYIADGHHRAAAAASVAQKRRAENSNPTGQENYEYFTAVLVPHDQINILAYNRAVTDLNSLSSETFLARVSERFSVYLDCRERRPRRKHEFCLHLDGRWHRLVADKGGFDPEDPVKSLDVSILQDHLLAPVLGITDPRTDQRLGFIGGIKGTEELERLVASRTYRVAFSLFPTSLEELMAVADLGLVMPPKSTWFEPKLRSGLFVHLLE